jgi:hypothetical protein
MFCDFLFKDKHHIQQQNRNSIFRLLDLTKNKELLVILNNSRSHLKNKNNYLTKNPKEKKLKYVSYKIQVLM